MDKINSTYWFDEFDCFCLKGNDSRRFLNGINTSNILSNREDIIRTCWLTPTGNMRALLEVYNNINESHELIVLVLIGDINEIRKYCLDLIFPSDDLEVGDVFHSYRLQEIDNINKWRKFTPKLLVETNQKSYGLDKLKFLNFDDLQVWKINQAIPSFKSELNGKNNPLELGLADLIDFNKGCYLGQETMAKLNKASFLKQEIRVWSTTINSKDLNLNDNKIFLDETKQEITGFITSFNKSKNNIYQGLAMIRNKYLIKNSFFSEQLGKININKSIGSVFL